MKKLILSLFILVTVVLSSKASETDSVLTRVGTIATSDNKELLYNKAKQWFVTNNDQITYLDHTNGIIIGTIDVQLLLHDSITRLPIYGYAYFNIKLVVSDGEIKYELSFEKLTTRQTRNEIVKWNTILNGIAESSKLVSDLMQGIKNPLSTEIICSE